MKEKLAEIDRLKSQYNIHSLCRILGVLRSNFYHHQNYSPEKTQVEIADEFFAPKIKKIFYDSNERFGSKKIRAMLMREGLVISMKRISRLMTEMELECKQNRLRYWSTTARKYKYYRNKLGCVVNRCVLYYANVKKETRKDDESIRTARYIG